jgi:hypothetical protein
MRYFVWNDRVVDAQKSLQSFEALKEPISIDVLRHLTSDDVSVLSNFLKTSQYVQQLHVFTSQAFYFSACFLEVSRLTLLAIYKGSFTDLELIVLSSKLASSKKMLCLYLNGQCNPPIKRSDLEPILLKNMSIRNCEFLMSNVRENFQWIEERICERNNAVVNLVKNLSVSLLVSPLKNLGKDLSKLIAQMLWESRFSTDWINSVEVTNEDDEYTFNLKT